MLKYYLIYKTTNLVNGRFYIGKHITNNKDDDYMGSGKILKLAINKYGIEKFKKKVLYECKSKEEMDAKEKEIVTHLFVCRKDTYNLAKGGKGGWHSIVKIKNDPEYREYWHKLQSDKMKRKHALGLFKYDNFRGKKHTQEYKDKIGRINSIRQRGKNNSHYGTMWITNGIDSTRIKKYGTIPIGWYKGRIIRSDSVTANT